MEFMSGGFMFRNNRPRKGISTHLDIPIVAFVVLVCIIIAIGFQLLGSINFIIGKQEIQLSIEMDDSGSELVSLLGATSSGMTHMEILGDTSATGSGQHVREGLDGLKSATDKLGTGYNLSGIESAGSSTYSGTCILDDSGEFSGEMAWPMQGTRITDAPGWRIHPDDKICKCHAGIDIGGDGMDVLAAADGVVSISGWNDRGYGNMITLTHDGGYRTLYGHLSEIEGEAAKGREVKKGQKIGVSGDTGESLGSHLHFELKIDNRPINPCGYMENAPSGCETRDRCYAGTSGEMSYVAQVPVPGAQPGNLKKNAVLVKP